MKYNRIKPWYIEVCYSTYTGYMSTLKVCLCPPPSSSESVPGSVTPSVRVTTWVCNFNSQQTWDDLSEVFQSKVKLLCVWDRSASKCDSCHGPDDTQELVELQEWDPMVEPALRTQAASLSTPTQYVTALTAPGPASTISFISYRI